MKVITTATVTYYCDLSEADSKKVKSYAKKHDLELEEAVEQLYAKGDIKLYESSKEIEFSTESIESVEEE